MDLSEIGIDVGSTVASEILSFIEGMKIGYHIGVTIDNILFNTDKVSDSYVAAYASAKAASYLKLVLQDNTSNLVKNHSLENAELFCETFNMYKWIQEDVANKMIQYFSVNQQSLIDKIFMSGESEASLYQWQIMKLSWSNINCHEGILSSQKMKCITIACPVDTKITDTNGGLVLKMSDDIVDYCSTNTEVCVRNAIKYIIEPDADYNIEITATNDGTMSYSIESYDNFVKLMKTANYANIKLTKNSIYSGKIIEGLSFTESDCALTSNGDVVDCNSTIFTKEERIGIDSKQLSLEQLTIAIDERYTLQAKVIPENASVKTLTWYSEDDRIATINEYGVVVAKNVGETFIICMTLDGKCIRKCKLNVEKKSGETYPNISPIVPPTTSTIITPTSSPTNKPTSIPTNMPSAVPTPTSPLASYDVSSGGGGSNSSTQTTIPSASPKAPSTPKPTTSALTPDATTDNKPLQASKPASTQKPSQTNKPNTTAKPSKETETGNNNNSSTNSNNSNVKYKLKKGSKVTDKKTKAVYKIIKTGKKKAVQYTKSTKKNALSITIPDKVKLNGKSYKVTSIGKSAFKNNKNLKKVKIGNNIKTIGQAAFSGCKNLTDLKMGENITNIKANAFNKCISLTIITIPSKVNKIGNKAFYQCKNLRYILVKSNKLMGSNIGKDVFSGGYSTPRIKTDKSKWKLYCKIFTESGMSLKALYVIDPVKLVI